MFLLLSGDSGPTARPTRRRGWLRSQVWRLSSCWRQRGSVSGVHISRDHGRSLTAGVVSGVRIPHNHGRWLMAANSASQPGLPHVLRPTPQHILFKIHPISFLKQQDLKIQLESAHMSNATTRMPSACRVKGAQTLAARRWGRGAGLGGAKCAAATARSAKCDTYTSDQVKW